VYSMALWLGTAIAGDLPEGVSALRGLSLYAPGTDLELLGELIGDASVVGLGESAHLSGGILRVKAELTRYLVEEEGFRVLAYETEWTDMEAADAWLQSGCEGDLREAVKRDFRGIWREEGTVELLRWVCSFNAEHPDDPVHLLGFNNMQSWHDRAALAGYAPEAAPLLEQCIGATALSTDDF
jgi:erythromycin esterase-like protein